MEQFIIEYLQRLDYLSKPFLSDQRFFSHAVNGHSFILKFVDAAELAGLKDSHDGMDMLLVLNGDSLKAKDVEVLKSVSETLSERVGVAVYQNDALEHVMKDIWFFLNSVRSV